VQREDCPRVHRYCLSDLTSSLSAATAFNWAESATSGNMESGLL
jgi:hypothetical protein